jgi:hypothetical protein
MNLKNAPHKMIAEITKNEVNEVWDTWLNSKPICCFRGCDGIRTKYSIFCFKHMYMTIKTAVKSSKKNTSTL